MSDDIVDRLRNEWPSGELEMEAADFIARLLKHIDLLHDEIERLRVYNKQLEDRWNDISYERNDLLKEIERLRTEIWRYVERRYF